MNNASGKQIDSSDRELVRALARRLSETDPGAERLRREVAQLVTEKRSPVGGVYAALRRSPLVGVDLDLSRPRLAGRKTGL